MPNVVTHVLVAIIAAELIRDYFVKDKRSFPLHYVLIAGIAGVLPDFDLLVYVFARGLPLGETINSLGVTFFHPSFTHSIIFPVAFLLLGVVFFVIENKKLRRIAVGKAGERISKRIRIKERKLRKHHLVLPMIFFMIAIGWGTHLLLDGTLSGHFRIGFTTEPLGLNLIPNTSFGDTIIAGLDAALLILWLIHEELRHKISRFI